MTSRRHVLQLLATLPALQLFGCGNDKSDRAAACSPIQLDDGHECTLCGMTIVRYAGPKGQACLRDGRLLPFCSVRDLLAWAWQPEAKASIETLHVHDLARTDWDRPSDDAYMLAEAALYVVGHNQLGAMGHSPAPFSAREAAERFARRHGGELVEYAALDWDAID